MKGNFIHILLIFYLAFLIGCSSADSDSPDSVGLNERWLKLDKGLELGRFSIANSSEPVEPKIYILRIDPHQYQFKLLNASAIENGQKQTAKKWCDVYGLAAAINASMYQKDHKTSVSLMQTKGHINNSYISKDKTILAFNSKNAKDPIVKMIDRECDDFDFWKERYISLIQNIRMISCERKNVWIQQAEKWSIASIGIDAKDRVLFIHTPVPYSTHDFINILLTIPIQITQAMYVEGGPEAQLFIQSGNHTFEFAGTYENELNGDHQAARPIPNVIGIKKRSSLLR
jgi:hypothetical protein